MVLKQGYLEGLEHLYVGRHPLNTEMVIILYGNNSSDLNAQVSKMTYLDGLVTTAIWFVNIS